MSAKVLIVSGRDLEARDVLVTFVASLGLEQACRVQKERLT
jgi:hypothetical protein